MTLIEPREFIHEGAIGCPVLVVQPTAADVWLEQGNRGVQDASGEFALKSGSKNNLVTSQCRLLD